MQQVGRAMRPATGRKFGIDIFQRFILQPVGTSSVDGIEDIRPPLQAVVTAGAAELTAAVEPAAAALGVVVRVAANFLNGLAASAEEQERSKGVNRALDAFDEHRFVEAKIVLPASHFVAQEGVNLRVARGGSFGDFLRIVRGRAFGFRVARIERVSDRGNYPDRVLVDGDLPVVKALALIRQNTDERDADDAPHPPALPQRFPFRVGHVPLRGRDWGQI